VIREGVENIIVESCFPVKLAHGHILNLINKGVKRIFIPSVITMKKQSEKILNSFACPYAPVLALHVEGFIDFDGSGVGMDVPLSTLGAGDRKY